MLLRLDFSSDVPIYQQIRNQIVLGIADGRLAPGERLPTIRALAEEMYKLVYAVAPTLFGHSGPACVDGACTEGKMSCGKAAEVRAHYEGLRKAAHE